MKGSKRILRPSVFIDRALSGGVWGQIILYVFLVVCVFLLLWLVSFILAIPLRSGHTAVPENGYTPFWSMVYWFYPGALFNSSAANRPFVYITSIIGSILMSGLLISTLTNILRSRAGRSEEGLVRHRLSGHTLVIGYNGSAAGLVARILEDEGAIVSILSEAPVKSFSQNLLSKLPKRQRSRVFFNCGDRTSAAEIASLRPQHAEAVFILDDPVREDIDSANIACLGLLSDACAGRSGRLRCTAVFRNASTVTAFQRADVAEGIKDRIEFYPLIYNEVIAQNLLVFRKMGETVFPPLDRERVTEDSNKYVHLIILGMSAMGEALAVEAARVCHLANASRRKTRITLIDNAIELREEAFRARYQTLFDVLDGQYAYLGDFVDIDFAFVSGKAEAPATRSFIAESVDDPDAIVTVAVCHDDAQEAIDAGLNLPRVIYDRDIPVFIYQQRTAAILDTVGSASVSLYSQVYPFGREDDFFYSTDNPSLRYGQRINYVYAVFFETGTVPTALPEPAEWKSRWIEAWNNLVVAKQWSNIYHADSFPFKLRGIGYDPDGDEPLQLTPEEVERLSRIEHNRWCVEELLMGYRPATEEERAAVAADPVLKRDFRNRLVHVDLCRFEDLLVDAQGHPAADYDRIIVESLPLIIG